jgi:hypothetical protein
MNKKLFFTTLLFITVNSVLFYNCSPSHRDGRSGNYSLDCLKVNMSPTFEDGYWPYVKTQNCKQCHSSTGLPGIPHFADSDPLKAIVAFIPLGPNKISSKLSIGHQGYNYSLMQEDLNEMAVEWNAGVANSSCEDSQKTSSQSISFFEAAQGQGVVKMSMRSPQTLVWNLNDRLGGLSLSLDVAVDITVAGMPVGYIINNLKVKSTEHNVRIKNITLLLNDKDYSVTTFKYLEKYVEKNSQFESIVEFGSSAFFEKNMSELYSNSDRWSLSIELIQAF